MDEAVREVMPLVLVMIRSTPQQLHSIEWAVAELNSETGKIQLHGKEAIWAPEANVEGAMTDIEAFDTGLPDEPTVEPRKQDETPPDA